MLGRARPDQMEPGPGGAGWSRTGAGLVQVVNFQDAAYGAEHVQMSDQNMDPSLTEFDWPSFAYVAVSLGGQGVRVASDADLDIAENAIQTRRGPLLIELCLDPHDMPRMRI